MPPKIGTIPRRPVPPPPAANPLDMVNVMVGTQTTVARPFELATNSETGVQYPSRASTSCPGCGHGIIVDIRQDQLLSGQAIRAVCDNCKAGQDAPLSPLEDPFRNPLAEGLITRGELDPLYIDPATIKTAPRTSASARVSERRKKQAASVAPDASGDDDSAVAPVVPPDTPEAPSDAKKVATAGTGTGTGCGIETSDAILTGLLSDNPGDSLPDLDVSGPVDDALEMGEEPDGD